MGKHKYRERSGAYEFLGNRKDDRGYEAAHARDLDTGKETTFNHRLFEGMAEGTKFSWDHNKSHPDNPVVTITDEEVPAIIAADKAALEAVYAEAKRVREANIATGRFQYFYTPFREGQAENIIEFLSDKVEDFWQIFADNINSGERIAGHKPTRQVTVEELKKDERHAAFMSKAQPGDKLEWYTWNGGFLAYSSGPCITRDGAQIAYYSMIVS